MQPADLIRDGQGTIWLTEVKCSGSEITLLKCIYTTDTLSCSHYHDVGIHCFLNCSKEDEGMLLSKHIRDMYLPVDSLFLGFFGQILFPLNRGNTHKAIE